MIRLVSLAALAMTFLVAPVAMAQPEISPSEIIDIAESGVGSPYVWGGGCWDPSNRSRLGADCSGYVGKVWQIPDRSAVTTCSHPYSTWNYYNERTHWDAVDRGDAQHVDAFVYNNGSNGHIVLFSSGDPWGNSEVYEARGSAYGIVHRTRTFDSAYRVRRRRSLIPDGPPPHPVLTLSTGIDTIDGQARDLCTLSGSEGLFDLFAGQTAIERLYVTNDGDAVASDVVVGIEVTSSSLRVDSWEIYDDWAGHSCGDEWCLNDSNDNPDNPAHDTPGSSFVLHLYGLSPGESKMIVIDLTALEATLANGVNPELRFWVRRVRDFYTKDGYDSGFDNVEGYQTFNGGDLRSATRQTVIGEELCNNIDDNCDGVVDEGFDVGATCMVGQGECAVEGVYLCANGELVCDGFAGGAVEEICGNGLDDDCDGEVDEACDPDGEAPYTSGPDPDPGTHVDETIDPVLDDPTGLAGGCACTTTTSSPTGGLPIFGGLLLAAILLRRRREG